MITVKISLQPGAISATIDGPLVARLERQAENHHSAFVYHASPAARWYLNNITIDNVSEEVKVLLRQLNDACNRAQVRP